MNELITFVLGIGVGLFAVRQIVLRYADDLEKQGYIEGDAMKAWRGYWIKRKLWSK